MLEPLGGRAVLHADHLRVACLLCQQTTLVAVSKQLYWQDVDLSHPQISGHPLRNTAQNQGICRFAIAIIQPLLSNRLWMFER